MRTTNFSAAGLIPETLRTFAMRRGAEVAGLGLIGATAGIAMALASWSVTDPSFNHAAPGPVHNLLGAPGAIAADLIMQMLGVSAIAFLAPVSLWGWRLIFARRLERVQTRLLLWLAGGVLSAGLASLLPVTARWPLPTGLGGVAGDAVLAIPNRLLAGHGALMLVFAIILAGGAILCLSACAGLRDYPADDLGEDGYDPRSGRLAAPALEDRDTAGEPGPSLILLGAIIHAGLSLKAAITRQIASRREAQTAARPVAGREREGFFERPLDLAAEPLQWLHSEPENAPFDPSAYAPPATREANGTQPRPKPDIDVYAPRRVIAPAAAALKPSTRALKETQPALLGKLARHDYVLPPLHILAEPKKSGRQQSLRGCAWPERPAARRRARGFRRQGRDHQCAAGPGRHAL